MVIVLQLVIPTYVAVQQAGQAVTVTRVSITIEGTTGVTKDTMLVTLALLVQATSKIKGLGLGLPQMNN